MVRGKKVVITGATSGIGLLLAQTLSQRGAIPIITGRSSSKLAEAMNTIPGEQKGYVLDVTNQEQVDTVMAQIIAEHQGIDVLVNNAGFGMFESIVEAPVEHYAQMMDTNYLGLVRCTKAVLPDFLRRDSGHIINIASMAGKIGTAKSTGYTATKHAVLGFTNALRAELAGSGIAVSAVNPGPIDTPFFATADPGGTYVNNVKWFMMPPDRVVQAIIKVIEQRKAEVDLPRTAAVGIKLYQLFPRLLDRLTSNWLNKK
ncbi:SDR family NAD(P)-dependent oxidoreductase [Paenibacillus sp. GCM10012307]|uniref:SDR family oxidoreductase n=1 Tax=Paenibacillus roseus TaxID=2798579 RepID=A0A934MR36_9BACL|nr:SDR family oxidoreductase [Paenibacillus roseus]